MAGIAGIYCADGRPADLEELRRMVAAVENRGPDGITYWNAGAVAFAHLQFHTTQESLDEHQPLISPGGEACLVWNGRIDNREALLAELAAKGTQPRDRTDPSLALEAYLLWGAECVQRIVGDFALAVWDARQRRLWCGRDYIGIRPFYYFWDGKTFLFGPEIRALLAHPLVSVKINEGMVGEYLLDRITSRDETLYADIRRLPSGSTLEIDAAGGLRIASWWKPELSLLNYRSNEEYAEDFRHLFDQSIRAQMRCNTPWGIMLSGGLDSSSIAVSARAVLDESGMKDAPILTFSMTSPGKAWDESEDIAAVVQKATLTPEFVEPRRVGLEFFRDRAAHWRDFPGTPNSEPMTIPIMASAKRRGVRVLLNGVGGDEWLDGQRQHMLDLGVRLALREMLKRARADWEIHSSYGPLSVYLARSLIAPAVPHELYLYRKRRQLARESVLSHQFLQRTRVVERIFAVSKGHDRRFASRAQAAVFRQITGAYEAYILESVEREAAHATMEFRFPFFHRPLAEFCLRLPEEQRQNGVIWKLLLRNAMRKRLPERVNTKLIKAEFSDLFHQVFGSPQTASRLRNLAILRHTDWLDSRLLQQRLAQWTSPGHSGPWPLWMLLGTDLWFEQAQALFCDSSGG